MYSIDFKKLVLKLYKQYKSYRKVCSIVNISISTLSRWINNGIINKKRNLFYNKIKDIKNIILTYLLNNPFITINEIKNLLFNINIKISYKTIINAIKNLNFTKKKASHKVNKNQITELEKNKLKEFFNKNNIYSIDECYFSEKVLPNYGYSKKGERLNTLLKPKKWNKRSLLMAISVNGDIIYKIYNKSINSIIFNDFINNNLQNQFILMDNVSFHKTNKTNNFFFIPPYSPEYNPIEYCFSKIKNQFRKLIIQNKNIEETIIKSIGFLNKIDIKNYFQHVKNLIVTHSVNICKNIKN